MSARGFHIWSPIFHDQPSGNLLELKSRAEYHKKMRNFPRSQHPDRDLEARLVFHYSRVADWLGSRSWYTDDDVTEVVKFLISGTPKRVLELCCGSGLLIKSLSAAFPSTEFVATDMSPVMVERAKANLSNIENVQIFQSDWIGNLPTAMNKPFDVVVVKNALHLLHDLPSRLSELRRVCGEWTSLIIVETISPNADANGFVRRLFKLIDVDRLKQNFFTERTLSLILADAGWNMAQSRPWFVRQHIDTEDWLRQRCRDRKKMDEAVRMIAEERNIGVRQSMDFYSEAGVFPRQMLRLQYIARHVYLPKSPRRIDDFEELQLTF